MGWTATQIKESAMSELLKINVNEHTEKKGGLTYLSWAWAWAEVLKYDPKATWAPMLFGPQDSPQPYMPIGETAMVGARVTVDEIERTCLLPVMDNRNNAVKNPDARKISDAIMRCMTKAIAMHGLGLYIYAGEDLPEGAPEATPEDALEATLTASIEQAKQKKAGVMAAVLADIHLDASVELALGKFAHTVRNAAEKSMAAAFDEIEKAGLNSDERTYLWSLLPSNVRSGVKREREIRLLTNKETA
jgi:hypothetical protein